MLQESSKDSSLTEVNSSVCIIDLLSSEQDLNNNSCIDLTVSTDRLITELESDSNNTSASSDKICRNFDVDFVPNKPIKALEKSVESFNSGIKHYSSVAKTYLELNKKDELVAEKVVKTNTSKNDVTFDNGDTINQLHNKCSENDENLNKNCLNANNGTMC